MKTKSVQLIHSTLNKLNSANPPVGYQNNFLGFGRPLSLAGRFVFRARTGARLLGTAALIMMSSAFLPLSASAAGITWGPATSISVDSDVANSGTALYAYAGTAATVNGVSFTAGSNGTNWGSVNFSPGFGSFAVSTFSYPGTGISTAYSHVVSGAAWGSASGTVTLNGLTPGHDYAVQYWANDPRNGTATWYRNVSLSSTGGNTVTLPFNSLQAAGGLGSYSVGTFSASATNQAITVTGGTYNALSSALAQLNAISMRDLGSSTKTWLGGSSTSWGTVANWNPASAPIVLGDSVLFNNTSAANLATVLDVSYTLVTLTLSNTAAPISIGPSSGNTLTISGGINLTGTSQNLTINDPLVFSASQTWSVTNGGLLAINGGVSGNGALNLAGGGTVSFGGAATYTGGTTISAGNLVMGSAGTLASTNITVAGGATFDVSAESPNYALNGGTFKASSAGAVINGTSDFSSGTISMSYDGVNPPFIQTNGTLTLSGGTVINVNIPGAVLLAGNYTIIAAATLGNIGQVTGSLPSVNLTGNGAVSTASLAINGSGGLDLVVSVADVWTGAADNTWANGGNWIPANEPNVADAILFNNLSTANLTITQNDPSGGAQWGVSVINPAGPVIISGPNSLQLYAGGFNLSAASQNLTITAPLVINADQNWLVTNARTLAISGPVSTISGGNVTIVGAGKVQLGAAHVLDELTNASPGAGDFTVNSTLDFSDSARFTATASSLA